MTKSPHKLMLRKETLRALNTIQLARVVGGVEQAGTVTLNANCPQHVDIVSPTK